MLFYFQIFSNGDIDPWGPGGQLVQIRPDLPTPLVKGGAHHYDLRGSNVGDTDAVKIIRTFEETTIKGWIANFWSEKESELEAELDF